jgi:hypothetical protein
MGFLSNYTNTNPTESTKRIVNIEWVLSKLDEIPEMTGTTLGLVKLNGNYTFTGTINVPTPALPS